MALFRGPKAPQLGLVASSASLRNGQTQLVVIISVWICGLFRATQHRYQQQAVGEYTMLGPRTSTRRNDDYAGAMSRGDVNRISNPRPRERSFASHKTRGFLLPPFTRFDSLIDLPISTDRPPTFN